MMNDDIEQRLGRLTPRGVRPELRPQILAAMANQLEVEPASPWLRWSLPRWFWPCATAASLLAAVTFGCLWASGGKPRVVERIVYMSADNSPATFGQSAAESSSPLTNWRLTKLVQEKGIDALPQQSVPVDTQVVPREETTRNLLDELLSDSKT